MCVCVFVCQSIGALYKYLIMSVEGHRYIVSFSRFDLLGAAFFFFFFFFFLTLVSHVDFLCYFHTYSHTCFHTFLHCLVSCLFLL